MGVGLFVVFEGPDGSGKSTALAAVAERFRARGQVVVSTREPGGCDTAELIRSLLMRPEMADAPVVSQLLLMTAARAAHLRDTVLPALQAGKLVLSDRYVDSSYVYQCTLGGLDPVVLQQLNALLEIRMPDLRLFFDLDASTALSRMRGRTESNRFDEHAPERWQLVADAYKQRSREASETAVLIDASASPDRIADACESVIQHRLKWEDQS